jgi:hypothetical protein
MKQRHNTDARVYHEYYLNQAGKGYPVYVGTRYQRGHGLGSIFESLFKSAVTLLKRGATTLGREALKTGLYLVSDVMEGKNVTQAAKSRLKSTGQSLLQKAMDTVGPPGERSLQTKSNSDFVHSQESWCTRAIFTRRCLSMCSVASSDDVWAFSVLQLVL